MLGLSEILLELASLQMFGNVESVDYYPISKDHIGDIVVKFNNQLIRVNVFNGDNGESVARKIINKASFKNE